MIDVTASGAGKMIPADCVVAAIRERNGLQLTGAVIEGPLCLDFRTVDGPLALLKCTLDDVQAINATFKNVVKLDDSSIGGIEFLGSVFERVLLLRNVTVRGTMSLWSTRMQSGLAATSLRVRGRLCAREMSVTASADFSDARLYGHVTFERAHVGQTLFLSGSTCMKRVSFDGADAAHVDARGSRFARNVTFRGTHVTGTVRLDRARFMRSAVFEEFQARDFSGCSVRFGRLVTFRSSAVSAQLTIERATFDGGLRIDGLHAGAWRLVDTRFERSYVDPRFEHRLDTAARVLAAGSFVAKGLDVTGDAMFAQLHLDGDLRTTGGRFGNDLTFAAVSCRSLDLSGAAVAGRLSFDVEPRPCSIGPYEAKLDVLKLENVSVMQDVLMPVHVKGHVKLRGLVVAGWLDLRGLRVEGTGTMAPPAIGRERASLRAQFLNVARDADVDDTTRIVGELDLTGAKIGGALNLPTTPLPRKVTLNSAMLGALVLTEPSPDAQSPAEPAERTQIDVVNCAYGQLTGDPDWLLNRLPTKSGARWSVRKFIEGIRRRFTRRERAGGIPDRQPFLALERVLRTIGRDKDADAVYFKGRSRTRLQSPIWQWLPQSIFSGYGVKAWRTVACIVAIWLGAVLFFATTNGAVSNLAKRGIDPDTKKAYTVEQWAEMCRTYRPTISQAARIPLQILLPAAFSDQSVSVVESCPVSFEAVPSKPALPSFVLGTLIVVLKLSGLILIPLGIAMISGLIRPAARA
ncbi:MAG TPA: pentapeptide repeat-containing protein [Candidatus Elarobacter sp.]|nr:pentapeptide repeat-containing protein [Candidatus Elarobacter sp.]